MYYICLDAGGLPKVLKNSRGNNPASLQAAVAVAVERYPDEGWEVWASGGRGGRFSNSAGGAGADDPYWQS